jgi:biotin transporter BioY
VPTFGYFVFFFFFSFFFGSNRRRRKKKRAAFVRVGRFSFFGRLVVGVVYLTCLPE